MKNVSINLSAINTIAKALAELNHNVAYVGGAVISLYVTDLAAEDVRPTKDVGIVLQIASLTELERLRQDLISKGFTQNVGDNVMCRFRYGDIKVDVMSTRQLGWAPANPWFEEGFTHLETVMIGSESISILPLPYFLATKFAAFKDRGYSDPRSSHDLEDIAYILDNRDDITESIASAPDDVRNFLKEAFLEIVRNEAMQEAILGNLHYRTQTERFAMIMASMRVIIGH